MTSHLERGHFPSLAPLDAYGNGGFRFAEMSHRGSILCLPSGIWAWPPLDASTLVPDDFARVVNEADGIEIFLIGTGPSHVPLPRDVRDHLRDIGIRVDVMPTGPAARTYNVLMSDQRKVSAALIAVEEAQ
ncbi:Mth938-like domain-containing protein [Terrihabitans sp. B22-R8]|uniref:Mth938-like domain-containing protein n=1 Tax=Terrihabitans sp. B22-R8 TaxID=3425128 RepID=UPI00403D28F9